MREECLMGWPLWNHSTLRFGSPTGISVHSKWTESPSFKPSKLYKQNNEKIMHFLHRHKQLCCFIFAIKILNFFFDQALTWMCDVNCGFCPFSFSTHSSSTLISDLPHLFVARHVYVPESSILVPRISNTTIPKAWTVLVRWPKRKQVLFLFSSYSFTYWPPFLNWNHRTKYFVHKACNVFIHLSPINFRVKRFYFLNLWTLMVSQHFKMEEVTEFPHGMHEVRIKILLVWSGKLIKWNKIPKHSEV